MSTDTGVTGGPRLVLRLEGGVVAIAAIWLFARGDGTWLPFLALALAPDLSIAGYLVGPRVGAWTYNAAHSYIGPVLLGAWAVAAGQPLGVVYAWLAHIGIDRAFGLGLKYGSGFRNTHLGHFGRGAPAAPAA